MQTLLAAELNRVIAGPSIFEATRFQGVRTADRTGALLAQNPVGDRLKRLNRWLLEDAFPRELFRMQPVFTCHYMAGYGRGTALAVSTNGLDWEKPNFDVRPGSNLVQTDPRDSSTVWLDQNETDPQRRYKMWRSHKVPAFLARRHPLGAPGAPHRFGRGPHHGVLESVPQGVGIQPPAWLG
jgi:hypothetical protein